MGTDAGPLGRFFPGDSELTRRMRELDWATTALGPPKEWPEPLKHSVRLCLTSSFPIVIYWGPERIMLYNDPYIPFLGASKHPHYLARAGREAWSDIWDALNPLFERVEATGEATWSEDFQFFFARHLPREEVYVTFSVGPILLKSGVVGGFFCPCTEVTERVVGARRLDTLRKLAVRALEARTIHAACDEAAKVLAENPYDIPVAAIYLMTRDRHAVLKSVAGYAREAHPFPPTIALADGDRRPWPLRSVLETRQAEDTPDLVEAGVLLTGGIWPELSSKAIVAPIPGAPREALFGFALLGVGPRRVLDDAYRTFVDLIAAHIGTALANANAYEAEQRRTESLAELDRASISSSAIGAAPFVEEALRWLPGELSEGPATPASVARTRPADESSLPKARIIVADDNADMRLYIERLLRHDYSVIAVADGVAALQAARRDPPDVILADVMMPRLDGFELLNEVRSDDRLARVPIVLLSARAGEEATVEGMRAGADDYLVKPFAARELLARIGAHVRRKRAEEDRERLVTQLAESRRLFQQMAEATPDVIYVYDFANGRTSYMSARAGQVIGYTADDVIERGHRFAYELWHADDVAKLPEYRRRLQSLGENEVFETEYRVRQPDGGYRWLRSRVSPFSRDAEGHIREIIGVTQNISESKRAEEALRDSEQRFRGYFDLGLIGMAITSPTKRILEANDEICQILGYERPELLQKTWTELAHPEDIAADVAQFDRVMNGEIDGYAIDKRWIRKDGATIFATISVKCVRRVDRSVDYFLALLEDITERKRAEQALGRSHDELERRVIERTSQLNEVNEELLAEVEERRRAEVEALALKNALADELVAMTHLHEFSTRLLGESDLQRVLDDLLAAVMSLQRADFGDVQLYNPKTRASEVFAHRGHDTEFLSHFRTVSEDSAAYARALNRRERVIIEDVEADPDFAPLRHIATDAGFRAVQSTPMFSQTGEPFGTISTHFRRPHRPTNEELRMTDLYARQAAAVIELKQSEVVLRRYQQELQDLTTRLIEAQELQNKHLARELHDVLSQQLAAIGMDIERVVQHKADSRRKREGGLRGVVQSLNKLATDIHRMSRQIHPAILEDLGLSAAIKSECLAFSEQYGMAAGFQSVDLPHRVAEDVALCLYRVAQESLRNVGKHAGKATVDVMLRGSSGHISLTVKDNGVGLDLEKVKRKRGLGLVSMEERVRIVGGSLSITGVPGDGTQIEAKVPLRRRRRG